MTELDRKPLSPALADSVEKKGADCSAPFETRLFISTDQGVGSVRSSAAHQM